MTNPAYHLSAGEDSLLSNHHVFLEILRRYDICKHASASRVCMLPTINESEVAKRTVGFRIWWGIENVGVVGNNAEFAPRAVQCGFALCHRSTARQSYPTRKLLVATPRQDRKARWGSPASP